MPSGCLPSSFFASPPARPQPLTVARQSEQPSHATYCKALIVQLDKVAARVFQAGSTRSWHLAKHHSRAALSGKKLLNSAKWSVSHKQQLRHCKRRCSLHGSSRTTKRLQPLVSVFQTRYCPGLSRKVSVAVSSRGLAPGNMTFNFSFIGLSDYWLKMRGEIQSEGSPF
jgi:hypothetical protein